MFEKKIKNFFNSVTVCGEFPEKKKAPCKKRSILLITAGVSCAILGAILATRLIERVGEEAEDEEES